MLHKFDPSAVREIRIAQGVEATKSPLGLGETQITVDAPAGIEAIVEKGVLWVRPAGETSSSNPRTVQKSKYSINLNSVQGLRIGDNFGETGSYSLRIGDDIGADGSITEKFGVNIDGRSLVLIKAPVSIPIVQG